MLPLETTRRPSSPDITEPGVLHIAVLSLVAPDGAFLLYLPPEEELDRPRRFDMISTVVSKDRPFRDQLYEYLKEQKFPLTLDRGWMGSYRRVRSDEAGMMHDARRLFFSATVDSEFPRARLTAAGFLGFDVKTIRQMPAHLFRREVYKDVLIRHAMVFQAHLRGTVPSSLPFRQVDFDARDLKVAVYMEKNQWYYPLPPDNGTN